MRARFDPSTFLRPFGIPDGTPSGPRPGHPEAGSGRRRPRGRIPALAALALTLGQGLLACARVPAPPESSPRPPLVVIGVDGLEWDVLLPLVRSGRAPHLADLMRRGTWGLLETSTPTYSPVLWTTIATGKRPTAHGIDGFTRTDTSSGRPVERLVRSDDRRCASLWTIASACGKRCALLGWWASFPAEPIDGVLVSQRSAFGAELAKGGPFGSLEDQVHPPELEAWVARVRDAVIDEERGATPGLAPWAAPMRLDAAQAASLATLEQRLLEPCRTSLRADEIYARLALELLREETPFDLLAVYLGSPDVIGHRFWRYHEPERYSAPVEAAVLERCGPLVNTNVLWIDAWVGRLVEAAGPQANIVVLSDHGMRAVGTDATFHADAPLAELNSGHHLDAPPAAWIAAGPSVRASASAAQAAPRKVLGLLDVLPTLLSWLDLPIGRDMPGRVAEGTVALEHLRAFPPRRIESYEAFVALPAPFATDPSGAPAGSEAGRARLDELRALGYLGASTAEEDGE